MVLLVTGGFGFIGSNFIQNHFQQTDELIVNIDLVTPAVDERNVLEISEFANHIHFPIDIAEGNEIYSVLEKYKPRAVLHFAAESHVDNSINNPAIFIRTNVLGTYNLLASTLTYFKTLNGSLRSEFRFLHVSTDEVYGALNIDDPSFTEESPYKPNSPYSASKAASDHFVRAYNSTFGLPTIITHCSNNYGPRKVLKN